MNLQPNTPYASSRLPLATYLTTQLQEIICMGPGHVLTWADNQTKRPLSRFACPTNQYEWMQVSVQGGAKCHLMVQFLVPEAAQDACKHEMDSLFAQYGWTHEQADGRESLVYYVAQSPDPRHLLDAAEFAAQQCAEVMARLWQARKVDDIALLGAQGPKLAKSRAQANHIDQTRIKTLTRAA